MLRHTTRPEVLVAFRVRQHENNSQFEILSSDHKLWWPVVDAEGHVSAAKFSTALENGHPDFLKLLHQQILMPYTYRLPNSFDGLNVRDIIENNRDKIMLLVQIGASRLLVCDDLLYMRGGEPAYVCDRSGTNVLPQYDTITVVDQNSLRPHFIRGVRKLGSYSYNLCEARASEGAVFRADEIERAKAFITEHRKSNSRGT